MNLKRKTRNMLAIVIIALVTMIFASCTTAPAPSPTPAPKPAPATSPAPTTAPAPKPTTSPTTAPTATPILKITSPTGNIFQIGDVIVKVELSNFTLVNKLGQANVPGEGHIHYFLDVDPPTAPGKPAVTAAGTYAAVSTTTYTWSNVGGGSHKFSAELVNNDHTPLTPPVVASVQVQVTPEIGPPKVVITEPKDGSSVVGGDIKISVQVANFNLVDKLGGANVPREGHIHYFMDVDAPTLLGRPAVTAAGTYAATAATSYTWPKVSAGSHTFSVELVNNDHTPLDPPVIVKLTITVTPPPPPPTPTPTATYTPTPTPTPVPPKASFDIIAQNNAFDRASLTVPVGAVVTINLENRDIVPHNIAVYTDQSASTVIFKGNEITGPSSRITYTFTAPNQTGVYFFRCDVHPTSMTGSFVVTQPTPTPPSY